MTELDAIALRYGTDKSSHGYCPHYERFIGDIRELPIVLLEIGVASGASLRTWRDWMPYAEIVGVDKDCPKLDGFEVFKADQGKEEELQQVIDKYPSIHVVIDDASHQPTDQRVSYSFFWRHLVSGGWYVVEDLDCTESCIPLGVFNNDRLNDAARGEGEIKEAHLISEGRGSGILFIKKR